MLAILCGVAALARADPAASGGITPESAVFFEDFEGATHVRGR